MNNESTHKLFSIIVPIYKVEDYLEECITSILNQDFQDFELILVDDGSPDKCGEICDRFAESYPSIKVIHKTNGGLSSARNAGIEKAEGNFLMFVDSDDWLLPGILKRMAEATRRNPDIIVFPFEYHYANGSVIPSRDICPNQERVTSKQFLKAVAQNKSFEQCIACNKAYNRGLFKENGLKFIESILHEDGPFFHEAMFRAKDISLIHSFPGYAYRKDRPGAITKSNSIRNFESLLKGVDHVMQLRRSRDRDAYFILLCSLVFSITQSYINAADEKLVKKMASSWNFKKKIYTTLFSRFDFTFTTLGVLVLISPTLTKLLVGSRKKYRLAE